MLARFLSMAFVCVIPGISLAQLPSQPFSSINTLGRYFGFGYSDGYHACKDGRCATKGKPKSWDSMSSFYDSPTLPPNNRVIGRQLTMSSPIYQQGSCVEPTDVAVSQSQIDYAMQSTMPTETAPPMSQPNLQQHPQGMPQWSPPSPLNFEPYTPPSKPSQPSPSDRGTYESVPAAPRQSQPATREREQLDSPAPLKRSDSKAPEAQYRRTPPGSYSLIQPTSVRAR